MVQINQLAAEQGHIAYQDSRKQSSPGWVPTLTLSGLDLQLPTFSTAPGRANPSCSPPPQPAEPAQSQR